MDTSLDDSLLSIPGPSRPRPSTLQTPPSTMPIGLGILPPGPSFRSTRPPFPDESTSFEYHPASSPAEPEAELEPEPEDQEMSYAEVDETYPESENSSAAFDPEVDPVGYSKRLDELAGTLEMSEGEARATRWGPSLRRKSDSVEPLPWEDFAEVLNHHLNSTEWKYHTLGMSSPAAGHGGMGDGKGIRVLGRDWVGREVGMPEWEDVDGEVVGMGISGLEDGVRGLGR
ncbi:hypothetical protein P7C73_g6257, partial [Tremellales sp. Uapishka_1]